MPRLDPREWCSRADVRAATKGEMAGGARTAHVELVGVYPRCRDALKSKFADVLQRLAALSLVRLIASGAVCRGAAGNCGIGVAPDCRDNSFRQGPAVSRR